MKCSNCETEHNSKFCPNCGKPADVQQQEQQEPRATHYAESPTKKKNGAFWVIFWIALVVVASLVLSLFFGDDEKASPSSNAQSESSSAISHPESQVSSVIDLTEAFILQAYSDDFKHGVRRVLQYHIDKEHGSIDEAEATGQWAGFSANLWLYKLDGATSFTHRVYYRAVHGEEEYIREFGYNQDFVDDVAKYFAELT